MINLRSLSQHTVQVAQRISQILMIRHKKEPKDKNL